jgi:hypothetical protein
VRDGIWLDLKSDPLTEAAKLTERFRRPNYGRLEIEFTVDDPKAIMPDTFAERITPPQKCSQECEHGTLKRAPHPKQCNTGDEFAAKCGYNLTGYLRFSVRSKA